MNVIVERDALAPALDALSKVIGRSKTIPILNNLLFEANDNKVTITAHALDYWMSVDVPAQVQLPGEITVLSDTLRSVIKGVAAGAQVSLTTKGERAELRAGRSRYVLPSLPAADFPPYKYTFDNAAAVFDLDGEQAKILFERPSFCTSNEETRAYLGGVYLHLIGDRLWSAATDGKKAYAAFVPAPAGADALPRALGRDASSKGSHGVIIPDTALDNIVRALATGGTVTVDANKVMAQGKAIAFGAKLIDGTYPDFWRIVPKREAPYRMLADRCDFSAAIGRLLAVSAGKAPKVRLMWSAGDDEARLTLGSAEKGEGEEFVSLFEPASGDHTAEYDPNFLMAILGAGKSERVEYTFQEHSIAAWIADPADLDTVCVVANFTPLHAKGAAPAEASNAA